MIEISDEFLDVDFPKCPEYTFGDCGRPLFGGADLPVFEDTEELIPESDWQRISEEIQATGGGLSRLVTRIYDQKSEGSCVSNATGQAIEVAQARQFGEDKVIPLSAMSLYKRVSRSAGSGSMLDDNYDEILKRGILPLDTPENRARFEHVMPNTGFNTPFPPGWEKTGAMFKGIEGDIIRSVAGIATYLLKQKGAVVVGRQGHSIAYLDWVYKSGSPVAAYSNSWSKNWGSAWADQSGGFGFDSSSLIRQSAGWAFGIRSVTWSSVIGV